MDNAFKFTNQGGVCLEVSGKGCQIQFQLRDTGVGIHKEHLAKIFDRFWQAKEFAYQGKGPGLTIAKGIVEAHKGKMWAESTYDQGSSIYFTLPV
jgi:signal transduction histidine kinase